MSDIGIRLDGLPLAAAISLSLAIFAIVALVAFVMATGAPPRRQYRIGLAKRAAEQAALSLACLLVVIVYINGSGPLPPTDWIDWLVLPWAILFLIGVVRLFRVRRRDDI